MTKARDIDARFLTRAELCALLKISVGASYTKLKKMEKDGFPKMHPILKRWDSVAVRHHLDAQAGLVNAAPVEEYRGLANGL